MPVNDIFKVGKRLLLAGLIDKKISKRPIVFNMDARRPSVEGVVLFPQLDLLQNIIELQDIIDIVPDPKRDLKYIQHEADTESLCLLEIETVYGKDLIKKQKRPGASFVPHLTMAEVISQISPRYSYGDDSLFFTVYGMDDVAEELAEAGYHAYRVAVFEPYWHNKVVPELSIDGFTRY